MKPNVVIIHPADNVAIALEDIQQGGEVHLPDGGVIVAAADIAYSHKVALAEMPAGADVVKYGEVIGQTREEIRPGEWVHTHNLQTDEE